MSILFPTLPSHSHPGGLDRYGCHHNRKSGYYHCHRPVAPEEISPGQKELEQVFEPEQDRVPLGNPHITRVRMVVNERILELADGQRVALIGIKPAGPIGDQERPSYPAENAVRYAKTLVEGRDVRLYFDLQTTDDQGRWLAYVYSRNGTFLNAELAEQGLAKVRVLHQNNQFDRLLLQLEKKASQARRGIWAHE